MTQQTVTLGPGESKLVSFEAVPHEPRTYQVSVNGLTGSFTATEPQPSQLLIDMRWDLYLVLWHIRHGTGNVYDDWSDYGWGTITYYQVEPLLKQAMIAEAIRLGIIKSASDCYFDDDGNMYHTDGRLIV